MRKNFGQKTWFYPLPVMIIGTYSEDGKADAMNAAWGGICGANRMELNLSANHKTTENIKVKGAFTVSFADASHVTEADYVGLVSANDVENKLEKAGFHITKSKYVDAPIIEELPMAMECRMVEMTDGDGGVRVVGEIINISADESILGVDGMIDPEKLQAISYDPVHNAYLKLGEKVGNAFKDGATLK